MHFKTLVRQEDSGNNSVSNFNSKYEYLYFIQINAILIYFIPTIYTQGSKNKTKQPPKKNQE